MVFAQPVRRSIRLPGFDYSSNNFYFVTICVQDRECLLGKIVNDDMYLLPFGHIVNKFITSIPDHYPGIYVDVFQIMPNHIHVITALESHGRTRGSAPTLGTIVQRFKTMTTHNYLEGMEIHGWKSFNKKLWQRDYYEHVIRDEKDLNRIREYIQNNVVNWHKDKLHS